MTVYRVTQSRAVEQTRTFEVEIDESGGRYLNPGRAIQTAINEAAENQQVPEWQTGRRLAPEEISHFTEV